MLKIGDFSKLAQVTVKALHHYARLGLLKPAWIDRHTGYRYYMLDQLPRLNRILALKDMGFRLEQIKDIIEKDLPIEQLREMFDQKQAELQQHLFSEQARLNRVAERLKYIEQEGCQPGYDIAIKTIPQQTIASMRATLQPAAPGMLHYDELRQAIFDWAAWAGLHSNNQWLVLHHNRTFNEDSCDIEIGLVIAETPQIAPRQRSKVISLRKLPGIETAASTLQPGNWEAITSDAYCALYTWIEQNGYNIQGQPRELLLDDSYPEKASIFTEIQVPVESSYQQKMKYLLNPYRKENEMEPKFITRPAFAVVGLRYFGKNENQEIKALWDVANTRFGELKHIINDGAYGVCITVEDAQPGEFEYVAGLKVSHTEDIPEGMVLREVPAQKYAVFTHVGSLETLGETYNYIYHIWLPQSGHELAAKYDFEFYNEDFKDFAPDSRFYIYVPIK
jgi:predicted transcriptional regulator YdeE/DNA-binding transcriptional MerR regulator